MQPAVRLLAALILLAPALAGCLTPEDAAPAAVDDALARRPGEGLRTDRLTTPTYDVLPRAPAYVTASVDGVDLYAEAYLPDGEGPWPTILVMSPYNVRPGHAAGGDVLFDQWVADFFVPRGYAVVFADVRGTGNSEGCMNMMGAKEQQDAHDVVEWVAAQEWSDGKVGMYGVSYVGTTPSEAAVMAPEHLVTIVPVAGVTNQWRNTFLNGVPYQGRWYPLTYAATFGVIPPGNVEQGPAWALNAAIAYCDQDDDLESVSPGVYEKGVYTEYWHERNLTARAKDVKASVFYVQGFTDRAVNPMEAIHWFNELDVPKKAWLGQWAHSTPPREDWGDMLHAWFDHWLKGIDTGVMDTPVVEVMTNEDTIRVATEWPPTDAERLRLFLAPGALAPDAPVEARESYEASVTQHPPRVPDAAWQPVEAERGNGLAFVTDPLAEDVHMAGTPWMHLRASVDAENTYFLLSLYEVVDGEWREITEGWMNAHLWKRFDESHPLTPGDEYTFRFRFEPREYVFSEGAQIGLRIKGHDPRVFPVDEFTTTNTVVYGGPEPSVLELPVLADPVVHERPDGV